MINPNLDCHSAHKYLCRLPAAPPVTHTHDYSLRLFSRLPLSTLLGFNASLFQQLQILSWIFNDFFLYG